MRFQGIEGSIPCVFRYGIPNLTLAAAFLLTANLQDDGSIADAEFEQWFADVTDACDDAPCIEVLVQILDSTGGGRVMRKNLGPDASICVRHSEIGSRARRQAEKQLVWWSAFNIN